ncbi:uncharacterized protein LOC111832397 [Capsella rubella]|uniref:uncharacterized protein LOC111832397 n=1 Tax=Capsella rubella TaxID=81985 RepID=UPI000CD57FCE|nr:uncharacterized protein LOC111832397 [Capsella rubella]
MAAEQAMRYPPRLYEEGMSSLKNKSMCTYFRMADFPGVRESIGQDAWVEIKQLPLGIVAKLVESKFVWSAKTVHYLLCRQLKIKHKELWCLVGGQPIRFGLNQFAHLTELNIDPTPSEKFEPSVDFKQFLTEELKVPGGEGPTYDELLKGLLPLDSTACIIPFEAAKIVSDDKAVKAYPWGRVAFETMVDNVKCLNPRVENEEIPLFRWPGTRTRSALDVAIAEDIKKYSELRVSTMVMKGDVSELFHTWPNQTEEDPELVNLVNDIHEEKLVKGFWDVKVNEDKKKAGKIRAAVQSESPAKKQKVEKGGDSGAEDAQKKKKKKKKINEEVKPHEQKNKKKKSEEVKADSEEDDAGGKASLKLLVGMVSEMKSSIETMKSKVETFDDKFTHVDEEFIKMKGLISFVARGGGLAGLMSGDVGKIPVVKFKFPHEKSHGKKVVVEAEDNKGDNKACDSDLEDITDNNLFENFNVLPESDVDEEERIRNERIKELRTANVKFAKDGSALEPQPKTHVFPFIGENGLTCMRKNCVPSVAIFDPFAPVDQARLERLLDHLSPYKATPYGKSAPEIELFKRLITERKDWPATDNKYGWLWDDHVGAFMRLLRKRFLEDPCPFHTKRIAFLDPWFTALLVHEYNKAFKERPQRFKFDGGSYERVINGKMPVDQPTGLKWIKDVDKLYLVIQVGGDHWIKLEADLTRSHIDVYDSIVGQVTPESEENIMKCVKPFAQMLPAMLNALVPAEIRPQSKAMFSFRRKIISKVPQNLNLGDCGVYSLKFVECLALGVSFDGLCDENIQGIRLKMAADIFDKAADYLNQFQ